MRTKLYKISTAILALATAFTLLSCSSGDGDDGSNSGSVSYQGKTYKTVKIGTQTWMAENLNYAAEGSRCYDDSEANCKKYGRLYAWSTAMSVCPAGWHLPSQADWDALTTYVETSKGCTYCDAKHLKSKNGWNEGGNGLDSYGFAALPGGGVGGWDGSVGYLGLWWSSFESESDSDFAYIWMMSYRHDSAGYDGEGKDELFSVRCLQD
ncbi:hypothetical protein R83H12_02609 [Fibrobacteria bacterium R8-3-H12]